MVFLYWILYVCICVPYMPLLKGIRATPYLRRSTLNTRLVKLPHGVSWPCCPHESLYICHNNNGHQAVSHSIIVPLHYLQSILLKHWHSYAQQCHQVSMSSLMKLSLSLLERPSWALPRLKSLLSTDVTPCHGPGVSRLARLLPLRVWRESHKNPIYLITVQTNEVKQSSSTIGTKKKTMVVIKS